jgi:hypothetical protein
MFEPDTVLRWRRAGWRLLCPKQRARVGRPPIVREDQQLIRWINQENSLWSAPRVYGEVRLLGIAVCQTTVAKYMVRRARPPSQTWRTFLNNHAGELIASVILTGAIDGLCAFWLRRIRAALEQSYRCLIRSLVTSMSDEIVVNAFDDARVIIPSRYRAVVEKVGLQPRGPPHPKPTAKPYPIPQARTVLTRPPDTRCASRVYRNEYATALYRQWVPGKVPRSDHPVSQITPLLGQTERLAA